MVQTAVGARCKECAQLRKLPTYQVPLVYYVRALGAGTGSAVALAFLWTYLLPLLLLPVPFLAFYLRLAALLAVGYLVGRAVSLAVNRKRSKGLQVIAGLSMFLSYLLHAYLSSGAGNLSYLLFLADIWGLLGLVFAVVLAVTQLK